MVAKKKTAKNLTHILRVKKEKEREREERKTNILRKDQIAT